MYIETYWGNYIGDTDDSLTLLAYLAEKGTIGLDEIFSDFGRDTLYGDFRQTDPPLVFTNSEGWEMDIHCAISFIADLAALLLECRVNGSIDLSELDETVETTAPDGKVRITATPDELKQINRILSDFAENPLAYDISEFEPEEETHEMAALCGKLRKELFG